MVRSPRAFGAKVQTLGSLAVVFALLVLFAPASASAFGGSELHAVYAGHEIPLAEVASHHCHDATYPQIQCFGSALERDRDLGSLASTLVGDMALPDSATSISYVTWYDGINYGGSSFTASTGYSDLSTIGWDNRISSFKSLNSGRPKWWQNTNFTSTSWRWAAGAQVPDVGIGANDQFSSVQNVP